MIRPLTLLSIVAAAGAGLHVYNTKHEVSLLDRELRSIAQGVQEAETRTQALQAEWAWATEQERLRALAQRHLALEPMQPAQFVRFAEAERRLPPPAAFDDGAAPLFAPGEPAGAADNRAGGGRIALLLPEAPPAPAGRAPGPALAAASAAAPATLAAVAQAALAAAAEALPLPAPAAPELRPVSRNPVAFTPRPVEARPPEPRPAPVEVASRSVPPPPPRPAFTPFPRAAAAATPARPAPEPPAPVAAPAPRPPVTHLAVASAPPRPPAAAPVAVAAVAPRPPEAATSLGSFGSALGSARAALPPPVAFGAAGVALR
jgi:hypothetical protein